MNYNVMKKIYLDHAATTPVERDVVEAMSPYYSDNYGNPSSTHSFGQEAKGAVEKARSVIAAYLGADSSEIFFTGSGTESNNLAIKGASLYFGKEKDHIITSSIEHPSVLETVYFLEKQNYRISVLPVDKYGLVDPLDVKKVITERTLLISVMHGNNEIGTIQPVSEIGIIAREKGVLFHVDAVQTFGHIPLKAEDVPADLITVSAHKIYGPKGVGALYCRKEASGKLLPLLHGGGQESGLRSSTHNVPGIAGFGKAAEIAGGKVKTDSKHITQLRDNFIKAILEKIENAQLNGHPSRRLPGNVNISFSGIKSDVMLLNLDMKGIACSSGSACKSSTVEPSHVLKALGFNEDIESSSIRFSIGRDNSQEELDHVLDVLVDSAKRLRAMRRS